MNSHKPAFTLIELIIVVSILGILSALVSARFNLVDTQARNTQARSDVVQVGKAIETFRTNQASGDRVIDTVDAANGSTMLYASTGFTGTMPASIFGTDLAIDLQHTGKSSYPIKISRVPGKNYKYVYATDTAVSSSSITDVESTTYGFYALGIHGEKYVSNYVFYMYNGESGECQNDAGGGNCPKPPSSPAFNLGQYLY